MGLIAVIMNATWCGYCMVTADVDVKAMKTEQEQPASPYLRGFSDDFVIPVSRWTEMKQDEIAAVDGLTTLLGSDEVGPCLVEDPAHRAIYIFNHFEYDRDTLNVETGIPPPPGPSLPKKNVENWSPDMFFR